MDSEECQRSSSPTEGSPEMYRNPSPPPETETETADGQEKENTDAIGETVYSKHWLFSTLTRLIQMVSEHSEEDSENEMQLSDSDEEALCIVWDMAMDKDVAGLLQEFKAAEILLGVISKSQCPRLTEICVGILGNIACFPESCLTLSQNEDLGAVLLLLLGDTDPPTLLETSRLLLTCLSQKDVSVLWLDRIRQQTSVKQHLCFIMSSSTNINLLEKVGELVDNLFDLDEELMKSWITVQTSGEEDGEESSLDLVSCLVEAARQLRPESPNGLEVYLHVLQLLTTTDEGIQAFAALAGPGKTVWDFVCELVCEDVHQTNDPSVCLQEQKSLLVLSLSVLQALYRCQDQWSSKNNISLNLIATILQVLQQHCVSQADGHSRADTEDEQLQTLTQIATEFLADICQQISKDTVANLVKNGLLTEKSCLTAAGCLYPNYKDTLRHLQDMLSEASPELADVMRKQFPD